MIGIYKITSPTDKVYIGQTRDKTKRFSKYKCGETKGQPKIHASIQKHGFNSHKIEMIHELPADVTQDVLDRYEQFYIQSYKDCGVELMNLTDGGGYCRPSEETRKKMSLIRKGVPLEVRIGKEAADRQKSRMSIQFGGKKKPKEVGEKISRSLTGKKWTPAHYQKLVGRKVSEESREKFRQVKLGTKLSEETKRKMSESHKKIWEERRKT